jgi:hypothetical protein
VGEFGHFIGGRDRGTVGAIGRACILVKINCFARSVQQSRTVREHTKRLGCCRRGGSLFERKGAKMKGSGGAPGFRL